MYCRMYPNNKFELVKITKEDIFTRMIKDDLSIASNHIKEGGAFCDFFIPDTITKKVHKYIHEELISYLETSILQVYLYLHNTLTLPEILKISNYDKRIRLDEIIDIYPSEQLLELLKSFPIIPGEEYITTSYQPYFNNINLLMDRCQDLHDYKLSMFVKKTMTVDYDKIKSKYPDTKLLILTTDEEGKTIFTKYIDNKYLSQILKHPDPKASI